MLGGKRHCVFHVQFPEGFADAKVRIVTPTPPGGGLVPVKRVDYAIGRRPLEDDHAAPQNHPAPLDALQPIFADLKTSADGLFEKGGHAGPIMGLDPDDDSQSRDISFKVVTSNLANAKPGDGENIGVMHLAAAGTTTTPDWGRRSLLARSAPQDRCNSAARNGCSLRSSRTPSHRT